MILLSVLVSSIVPIFCAQPRSVSLLSLDDEPVGQHYAKILSPPLAFSYTSALHASKDSYGKTLHSDSKGSDSVISQRRYKIEPEALKRLSSKRMLKPKKFYPGKEKQNAEDVSRKNEDDFYIYVPDKSQEIVDLTKSPIVVPELSEEESKTVEDLTDEVVEVEQKKEDSTSIASNNDLKKKKIENTADQNVQESNHKKKIPESKPKDTKYKKGEEGSSEEEHHKSNKDTGDKKYVGKHDKHKFEKEHHIKAGKAGHYEDEGGDKKKYHKGHDFHAEQYEEDEGQKGTKYEEDGENEKGHTTKGEHNIQKKDEYEKKIEFFDEYHDDSDEEEDGAYEDEDDFKKGHNEHKEHEDAAHHHDAYDDEKKHSKYHSQKYSKGKHHHIDGHHNHDHGNKKNHHLKDGGAKVWKIIVTHGKKN